MRKLTKLIAVTMMAAMLLSMVISCASADEKIYTSPVFKLPKDRLMEWVNSQKEPEAPEENVAAEEPVSPEEPAETNEAIPEQKQEPEAEQPAAKEEQPAEEPAPEQEPEEEQPAAKEEQPADEAEPEQKQEPEEEQPAEEAKPEQKQEPDTKQPEANEEQPAENGTPEQQEPGAENPAAYEEPENGPETTEKPERAVLVFSSQTSVVTEGEIIYLTSELIGFDDVEPTYQWQVDRGDGLGWVDIEGANRARHMFVASKETIQYRWRLVVSVNE